jgi:hypothetical protein
MEMKNPTGRLARWIIYLQSFNFTIEFRKGKKHKNVDLLSRITPDENDDGKFILAIINNGNDNEDISSKNLDPYEDEILIEFLRNGRFPNGASKNQCKRVRELAKRYKWEHGNIYYLPSNQPNKKLMVPKPQERKQIIEFEHLLGHFDVNETYRRVSNKYHWKKMFEDVKKWIHQCLTCLRHNNSRIIDSPARAMVTKGLMDIV